MVNGALMRTLGAMAVGAGLLASAAGCGGMGSAVSSAPTTRKAGAVIPNHYIVTLNGAASRADVARSYGAVPDRIYSAALNGFAASLTAQQVAALESDPHVSAVEPDRIASLVTPVARSRATSAAASGIEIVPTGVQRISADIVPRTDVSGVGIAIIDTGIWKTHEDLNVRGGCNFTSSDPTAWNDDNGHGTHVAGIAAAITGNGKGVRGVAPNARLYGVKVLDATGHGSISEIIAGIDWVAANASTKGIQVANMSIEVSGTDGALYTAIHHLTMAGVTMTVAAGNNAKDASFTMPANDVEVIAVSAISDSDGLCGARGPDTSSGPDDSLADYSNYGTCIALAAPGTDILSTYVGDLQHPQGSYATMSGTSMAAPHVAGVAAQYIASNPGATPAQVKAALISLATPQSPLVGPADSGPRPRGGFTGDPSPEPLVDALAFWWRHADPDCLH